MQKNKHTYTVLFLASWYPTRLKPAHGIFIQRHAEAIALYNKVEVVYAAADEQLTRQFEVVQYNKGRLNVTIVYYKKSSVTIPLMKDIIRLLRVRKAYRIGVQKAFPGSERPDIIHLNVILPVGLIALWLQKKFRVPLLVSEHWSGYLPEDGNYKGFLKKWLTRKVISQTSLLTVVSERMKESMRTHGLITSYERINYVVNTDVFYVKETVWPDNKLRLIHVSSLTEREKNISGILRVMLKLKNVDADFSLTIIGNITNADPYIQFVRQNGLTEFIHFAGQQTPEVVAEYIRKSHLFILFSYFEGMPNVLLESLSCGTPVISTKVGAVPEFIHEGLGSLIDIGNESQLFDAILKMKGALKQYESEKLHAFVRQHFSAEEVGKQFTSFYTKVLECSV